jgi:hypothetical protein
MIGPFIDASRSALGSASSIRRMSRDRRQAGACVLVAVLALAFGADGQTYVITDNDGVDDATGETIFLRLGDLDDD